MKKQIGFKMYCVVIVWLKKGRFLKIVRLQILFYRFLQVK